MAEKYETITEMVKKLGSHVAGVRREALVSIYQYSKSYKLCQEDADILKNGLLTMFVEKQPLVYQQFVDTLEGLLENWKSQITGWISMIISKFLQKLGTDTIRTNIEKRVKSLLINLINYYEGDLLLSCIFRAYSDASQPMNRKTIKESLHYLGQLCFKLEQGDFHTSAETALGFASIAGWYANQNAYRDIQKAARYALVSLFRLNSSTFTHLQSDLPITKEYHVRFLIQSEVKPSDSTSPLDEYMFLRKEFSDKGRESIEKGYYNSLTYPAITPPLKYSIETNSTNTTPSSIHSDSLEVTSPKRSASTEEVVHPLPTAFKSLLQNSKKTSTLPRMPRAPKTRTKLSLQPNTADESFSPSPSRLPLSRTQSVGEGLKKKTSKYTDYSSNPTKYTSKIPRADATKDDIYY